MVRMENQFPPRFLFLFISLSPMYLGERGEAVGGAGRVGHNVVLGRVVLLVVDAHDEHGGVGAGSGDDHLGGTAGNVRMGLLLSEENTGRLNNVLGTLSAPRDVLE